MNTNEIRKLSCYAVLRSGYTGDNYLVSHMRLVLLLIYRKQYGTVEPNRIVTDFQQEYQYYIDYFPMRKILSLAVTQGYLTKNHNSKRFTPTKKISEFKTVENDLKNSKSTFVRLIKCYIDFCTERGVDYTEEEAEQIVFSYINTQKLEHISGHIDSAIQDKRVDYLFGQFIYFINANDPELFNHVNSMVIGAILADCLVFHELMENGRQLDGLTIILDTTPVFISLGIDLAGRKEYYCNLLDTLVKKGAKLAMFEHSYNEMQRILQGTQDWIDSYQYDPAKSSDTTEYFRSIEAKREDVEEFCLMLKDKINDLKIEIIDIDYIPENYPYQIDSKRLTDMIVEQYRNTNPVFNEELQKSSIDLDVRSITMLYYLRKGQKPLHISDANYIFITANQSIAHVASIYHGEYYKKDKSLPSTLTDVFLGTYIWLSDPIQIAKMNEMQIMSQAYLAFQPNTQLLEKLSTTVSGLMQKGEVDSKLCYALRGSKLVSEKLMQRTLGDPDAYTDMTPYEIIQEIRAEAKAEERDLMRQEEINNQKLINDEKERIQQLHEDEVNGLKTKIEELQRNAQRRDKKRYTELNGIIDQADNYRRKLKIAVTSVSVFLAVVLIAAIVVYGFFRDKEWYTPIIGYITTTCTIMPIIMAIALLAFGLVKEKSVSMLGIINSFLDSRREAKLTKLGFSSEEYNELQKRMNNV